MLKLLVADESEAFTDVLASELSGDFLLDICHDGNAALEAMDRFQPDAVVLNLFLPCKDGLTVLQKSTHRPRVILAVTSYLSDYIERRAGELGVQYIVRMPTVESIRLRLMDMLATEAPKTTTEGQIAMHLHMLHFRTNLDGYRQLCVGIPMFVKDPEMRLSKELYPAIAEQLGLSDPRTVEHSVRKSIADAFAHRDPVVWERYFPGRKTPPTNKAFISCLSEMLEE